MIVQRKILKYFGIYLKILKKLLIYIYIDINLKNK